MRKKIILLLVLLFVLAFGSTIAIMAINFNKVETSETVTPVAEQPVAQPEKTEEEKLEELIEDKMSHMTLEQKAAQLLIVQAPASSANDETLAKIQYGGFILMEDAYTTLEATRNLTTRLRYISEIPAIISTDQEGGLVQRLQKISSPRATNIPSMYRLGQTGDVELAKKVGNMMGEELATVGVDVDFAPVLDVYSNPNNQVIGTRSFSKDPQTVAKMGLALADGLRTQHITPTFKHFPGHGDTAVDSHQNLPVINKTRAELDKTEFVPFKAAIESGAEMIMVGHIALPKITGDNTPATLSSKITTDLLRKELGFKGLIVTDGVNMGALVNNYSEAEIYYRAVNAGADLLVLPAHPELAVKSIKEHVSEERLNESVRRILRYKYGKMQEWRKLPVDTFGSAAHADIIKQIP